MKKLLDIGEVPRKFFGLQGDFFSKLENGGILIESLEWFVGLSKETHFQIAQKQVKLVSSGNRKLNMLKNFGVIYVHPVKKSSIFDFFAKKIVGDKPVWIECSDDLMHAFEAILSSETKVSFSEQMLYKDKLKQEAFDFAIEEELGFPFFQSEEKILSVIKEMILEQPLGEKGDLATDGSNNFFYAKDKNDIPFVLCVKLIRRFNDMPHGPFMWKCDYIKFNLGGREKGSRIFSPKIQS
jgi:hypothetical protein